MKKERFIELVSMLNDKELSVLISGINDITFEYGWNENLDDSLLIQECWKE